MKNVLVLESEPSIAAELLRLLGEHGLEAKAIFSPHEAIPVLEQETFDLVLSGALRWEGCYTFAKQKYGTSRIIIYTASLILARAIRRDGLTVYLKSLSDDGDNQTPEGLVKIIAELPFINSKGGTDHE